ncbi:MAG: hypothetical protein AAF696_10965, partial [Bacteroidota bacterium]
MLQEGTYNKRDGISQVRRLVQALDPASFKLIPDDKEYWFRFAKEFSRFVHFYNLENKSVTDWQNFFPATPKEAREIIASPRLLNAKPHLALFWAFLEMLKLVQGNINKLSARHLDYYYEKVLEVKRKQATGDEAFVSFQLSKNFKGVERLEEGTKLLGGKDENGKALMYQLERELIVNQAKIEAFKSVYVEPDSGRIFSAPIANSLDGLGQALPDERPFWKLFGENQLGRSSEERSMIDAEIGFAIASPIFWLKEGKRNIQVDIQFRQLKLQEANIARVSDAGVRNKLGAIQNTLFENEASLDNRLKELLTATEYSQFGALLMEELNFPFRGYESNFFGDSFSFYLSGEDAWNFVRGRTTISEEGSELQISISEQNLNEDFPAVVPLPIGFDALREQSKDPMLKFIFEHSATSYPYNYLKDLLIGEVKIEVEAKGVRNL